VEPFSTTIASASRPSNRLANADSTPSMASALLSAGTTYVTAT
jgi:hypothetical protein